MKNKGFWSLLLAGFIYAVFGVLIRGLDAMFTDLGQTWARSLVTVLIAFMIILIRRNSLRIPKGRRLSLLVFSLTWSLIVITFTYAINHAKIASVVAMLYVGSVSTSFALGVLVLKEKASNRKLLAMLVIFLGLVFLAYPFDFGEESLGLAMGLVSGMLEGLSNMLRKRLGDIERMGVVFYQFLSNVIIFIPLALIIGDRSIKEVSLLPLLILFAFGVLLVLVGNLLLYGFRHFDVGLGTIVLASELFFSMLLGFAFLAEAPTVNELIGGVLIFVAVGAAAR
ncbi:DMT family transporter [Candidatus Dojkabacteria bacterium]|uniref:DMT family transporter n=1 Tax=Candidatus Dojkabacteria bacterium TaxID=2099670 RepID=A0A955I4U4_9BACT|nr:DMT family transporter [Candidatus Dojkabacteria bacterium]